MPRRVASLFGLVALLDLLLIAAVRAATGSVVVLLAAGLVLVALSFATGLALASRLATSYNALVRRDQAITVAASHELRTPITALRLSLEDLTLWKQTPAEVSDELHRAIGELDRLSGAVTRLLDQHREDHLDGSTDVDLTALATAAVRRWRTTIDASRAVTVDAAGIALVRLNAGSVSRVLAAQLDQFDGHGTGDVRVEVARVGRTVRVRVLDQSSPRFSPGVIHGPTSAKNAGELLTLEEAGGLAESLGGYLAVEDAPTTCLSLILPAAHADVLA